MTKLRFDDRVAIVTGAGAGLGRSHALLLSSLGAKVVVNDLGGAATGEGKSASAADKVVDEIRAAGGQAVANYDSVVNGAGIVKSAVDAFGKVDILINNAGILRDVSFAKMTQAEWDIVLSVHLTGSMSVSHAAWPIMREQGFGRIVMTTSAAGIYGNFGQANYSAAKLGLVGLANTLAEEGRNKNVYVNTIAPIAASRLTETVLPPDILKHLQPEAVSPLVAWLCHEDCEETKGLFEVGAGYIAKVRWERSYGTTFPLGRRFSVDDVAARWGKITGFEENTENPKTINESMAPILRNITSPSLGGNEFIDLDVASKTTVKLESEYDENDLALYALGIGAARDPLDKSELKFAYEMGGDFQALPTFGVMPQMSAMLKAAREGTFTLPGMSFGFDRLLHGEQYTELKGPMPRKGKLTHHFKFKQAFDKDPNAVVTFAISTVDEDGNEIAYNEMTSFVKGAGGWGGDRGPSADINVPPAREPDAVIEEKTDVNQTLLFRLSGDWNPLHADPGFAKAFGYDRPILHGLCTFGHAGRHVIKAFCDNDGRKFKSIKVRFAKNVFPGETLVTRMWKESPTRIVFETSVKERNEVVIKNAAVELYTEIPKPAAKAKAASTAAAAPAAQAAQPAVDNEVQLADVFTGVAAHIKKNPGLVGQTKTSFQFHFHNPDQSFFIDLKNGEGSAGPGTLDAADVTLEVDTEHGPTIFGGDMATVQKLYFGGTLKIAGNVMASNKLAALATMDKQLVEDARKARVGAGGGGGGAAAPAASAAAAPAASQEATIGDLFTAIAAEIADKPEAVAKGKTVFQFEFENPESTFFIDLKNAPGSAGPGRAESPDVTISVDASHVGTIFGGDMAAVQKLYFGGQIKIAGNVMASNKLAVLAGMDKARVETARKARLAAGAPAAAAPVAKKEPKKALAAEAVAKLEAKLANTKGGTGVVQLRVKDPDGVWSVDLGANPPRVTEGERSDAGATITVGDSQLAALVNGESKMQELFQKGALTIDGNITLARQLEQATGASK